MTRAAAQTFPRHISCAASAPKADDTMADTKAAAAAAAAVDPTIATHPDVDNDCKGYGKLILFGEHFVVYNAPALVGAVSSATTCTATLDTTSTTTGLTVQDDRPAIPGYKAEKKDEADVALNLVLRHFDLDPTKMAIHLRFGGTLCAVSGIGASAAQVVAQARALSTALDRPMTEDEINAAGYEGERGYHGTPSGIDNTAATFGGVLRFQRGARWCADIRQEEAASGT